jgi:syntaxin 1B/2/3
MQSNRVGQARQALSAVQDRHAALQKIEQQMVELAQLFQDMDTLVVQQDVAVAQIEQKGEEVVENLDKGNEEIAVAVETAKKTRKKKWICLGIVGECNRTRPYPASRTVVYYSPLPSFHDPFRCSAHSS